MEKLSQRFLAVLTLAAVLLVPAVSARAADFPEREIKIIVPWNPGGAFDLMARYLQSIMEKDQGVRIIVENHVGGGGAIGMGQVAIAKPDGYTVGLGTSSNLLNIAEAKVPLKIEQFIHLNRASLDHFVLLVGKDSPHETIEQFLEYIKANPGKVSIGFAGTRSTSNIFAVMTSRIVNTPCRFVPYPGGSRAAAECMGGQVDAVVLKPSDATELIRNGDLVGLATYTLERTDFFAKKVPTFQEKGYDVFPYGQMPQMGYICVPAGTPQPVQEKLTVMFKTAFLSPEFQQFAKTNGYESDGLSGPEFEKIVLETVKTLKAVSEQVFK
jgi:tripartite-type tricarboxylate transporter receptor subunit TctC